MNEEVYDILAEMREFAWKYISDQRIATTVENFADRIEFAIDNEGKDNDKCSNGGERDQ